MEQCQENRTSPGMGRRVLAAGLAKAGAWAALLCCLLLASPPIRATDAAAKGLEAGQHSVTRGDEGARTPPAEENDTCVILLAPPARYGRCDLGETDPPARLIVQAWFDAPELEALRKAFSGLGTDPTKWEALAKRVGAMRLQPTFDIDIDILSPRLRDFLRDAFGASPVEKDAALNPAVGKPAGWGHDDAYGADSLLELSQSLREWADAWWDYARANHGVGEVSLDDPAMADLRRERERVRREREKVWREERDRVRQSPDKGALPLGLDWSLYCKRCSGLVGEYNRAAHAYRRHALRIDELEGELSRLKEEWEDRRSRLDSYRGEADRLSRALENAESGPRTEKGDVRIEKLVKRLRKRYEEARRKVEEAEDDIGRIGTKIVNKSDAIEAGRSVLEKQGDRLWTLLNKVAECQKACERRVYAPEPPMFPKPVNLRAIALRSSLPKLDLPQPHDLTAAVTREQGAPPGLDLPQPHDLMATVSRDMFIPVPENRTCQYGVSDQGTCLPKEDVWVCPFGVGSDGTCLPGGDGLVCPYGIDDLGQCLPGGDGLVCPYGVDDAGQCTEGPGGETCEYGATADGTCMEGPGGNVGGTGEIVDIELEQIIIVDGNNPFDPVDPTSGGDTTGGGTDGGTGGGTGGGGTGGSFDFATITTPPGFFEMPAGSCSSSIESSLVSLSGSTLTLKPFFRNGATTFNTSGNVATSTSSNLTILGATGHTCTVKPSNANTFTVQCVNNNTGATCSDVWTRQ